MNATTATPNSNLVAAIDMGTNSFKLLIVRADPSTGRFLVVDRRKEPVLLGLDATTAISPASFTRAVDALRSFQQILHFHRIPHSHSRFTATSAVREASNQSHFLTSIRGTLDLQIEVLSGHEEARLVYLGVLQFYPYHDRTLLTIDIGGGSTEFAVGRDSKILYSSSLKLGHVTLTKLYPNRVTDMRNHIVNVIRSSDLIDKVKEFDIDVVVGSSGTIRAIEKAVFRGYARNLGENLAGLDENGRDLKFCKDELKELVEVLSAEDSGVGGRGRTEGFFKRRSEFIVAGAVLLEEIFDMLGIEEMKVSGYSLGEGVIAEKLRQVIDGYDFSANARWLSVVRLATRLNSKKRMKAAAQCAEVAKEIYEGLRKWNQTCDDCDELAVLLKDKDLEYLEAACLLSNIGMYAGKKGYHKQSYRVIMNGGHLPGYSNEEVKLIALLVRHHRKKFPKCGHAPLDGLTREVKQKFRVLCTILRVSVAVCQHKSVNIANVEFSCSDEGFKVVIGETIDHEGRMESALKAAEDLGVELEKDLENFQMIFHRKLSIAVSSSTSTNH